MLLLLSLYARWVLADRCLRYLADTSQLSQQNVEEGVRDGGRWGVVGIVAAGVV